MGGSDKPKFGLPYGLSNATLKKKVQDLGIVEVDLAKAELLLANFDKNFPDIHRVTAAKMFGVAYEDVTPEQRQAGKTANHLDMWSINQTDKGDN